MKINKNSSIYFVSFFTVVIFGFILLLNFTHDKLKDQIETAKVTEINNILIDFMPCSDFKNDVALNRQYYYCEKSNIIALHGFSGGYIGKIEYLAIFDKTNGFIKHISIINHKETPGLGDKIVNKNWLATIYNKAADVLKIKKYGGQIDSFTAASVTPKYFLKKLQQDIQWIKESRI